jgi:APA family basic amino acid/polyamine antiporter
VHWAELVSIALVIFLTYINSRGVKEAKMIQRVFTSAKLLAIFGLIIFGFLLAGNANIWHNNWAAGFHLQQTDAINDATGKQIGWSLFHSPNGALVVIGIISSAMVGSVFSSDAWNNVTFIAGEMKNPKRNVGLSLFFGTLIVTVVYILMNLMYTAVLPLVPALQNGATSYPMQTAGTLAFPLQDRVATAAADNIFGHVGTSIIAVLIMISTFGCNNGLILAGARVYYAMAKDGMFLPKAAKLNKNDVPGWALWAQCVWTSLLCLSGTYSLLLDYVVFVALVFYIITIIGIFILRKQRPDAERPYRAWGYPFLPILYILLAGTMAIALLFAKWQTSLPGLAIVLLGIPVYYFTNKKEAM